MKSLVRVGVVPIVGLLILGYAEVWGADWKYFGGAVLAKGEEAISFYDAETVEVLSDGNVRVWIKAFTDKSEFKKVQVKKEVIEKVANKLVRKYYPPYVLLHPYPETTYDTYIDIIGWEETANDPEVRPRTRIFLEINCKAKMIRSLSVTSYDRAGVSSSAKGGEWDYIGPETNGETLHKILCPQKSK